MCWYWKISISENLKNSDLCFLISRFILWWSDCQMYFFIIIKLLWFKPTPVSLGGIRGLERIFCYIFLKIYFFYYTFLCVQKSFWQLKNLSFSYSLPVFYCQGPRVLPREKILRRCQNQYYFSEHFFINFKYLAEWIRPRCSRNLCSLLLLRQNGKRCKKFGDSTARHGKVPYVRNHE